MNVKYSEDVLRAKESNEPVLALESTIIAHGMPFPENLTFAKKAESLCRDNGVVPATIAVIDGVPQVGLDQKQLERIAQSENIKKTNCKITNYFTHITCKVNHCHRGHFFLLFLKIVQCNISQEPILL